MAGKSKGFRVKVKKRPGSGTTYWIVTGTQDGKQVRREFSEHSDALEFADQRNAKHHGVDSNLRTCVTELSPEELADAAASIHRLKQTHSGARVGDLLTYYETLAHLIPPTEARTTAATAADLLNKFPGITVELGLHFCKTAYRPYEYTITLHEAILRYLVDVDRRLETKSLSTPQVESIHKDLKRFERWFCDENTLLTHLTDEMLTDYLVRSFKTKAGEAARWSNKTWNNRRAYLTSFFGFCVDQKLCSDNPAKRIKNYKSRELSRAKITYLTYEQSAQLMEFVESKYKGTLVPYFALLLFAGIRPDRKKGEITKIASDNFDENMEIIHLRPEQTKTGKARNTIIQDNLREWLRKYPLSEYPIICTNFPKRLRAIRRHFRLKHDVLRHTFCTMIVGKFRSVSDAALQAGNSEAVMWSNYLALVKQDEANKFWEIRPSKSI